MSKPGASHHHHAAGEHDHHRTRHRIHKEVHTTRGLESDSEEADADSQLAKQAAAQLELEQARAQQQQQLQQQQRGQQPMMAAKGEETTPMEADEKEKDGGDSIAGDEGAADCPLSVELPDGRDLQLVPDGVAHSPGLWIPEPVRPPRGLLRETVSMRRSQLTREDTQQLHRHAEAATPVAMNSLRSGGEALPAEAMVWCQGLDERLAAMEARQRSFEDGLLATGSNHQLLLVNVKKCSYQRQLGVKQFLYDEFSGLLQFVDSRPSGSRGPSQWLLAATSPESSQVIMSQWRALTSCPPELDQSNLYFASSFSSWLKEAGHRTATKSWSETAKEFNMVEVEQLVKDRKFFTLRRKENTARICLWMSWSQATTECEVFISLKERPFNHFVKLHVKHLADALKVSESNFPFALKYYRVSTAYSTPSLAPLPRKTSKGQHDAGKGKGKEKSKASTAPLSKGRGKAPSKGKR